MKILHARGSRSQASVLIVVLSIVAVSAIALASYLTLVQGQAASVARSQSWNAIIPVAEAGVEDGLAMVNDGAPQIIINQWAWTNNTGANNWSGPSNNTWTIKRYVSGSNYYTAKIDISSGAPVITSIGIVQYTSVPWEFASLPQPMVAAAGMQVSLAKATMGRKIQAITSLNPLFNAAVVARSNLNLNGNNVTVDSFDSSNPQYSTLGLWDPLKRQANGDVATDSSIVGDASLGNANIYGHVYTGPGTVESAVQIGPNGSVGNVPWVNASTSGIQSGYWSGDFNLSVPDVPAPLTGSSTLPTPTNGNVVLNGGTYSISPNDPNISMPMIVTATTTLWVQGSYTPPVITFATNATLALYVGRTNGTGDSLSLGGNGAVNSPGFAQSLQFYGLPSLTSLSLAGNAAFIGTIYAPEANASFNGGGNNETDFSGSIVVNSLTMNGHFNIHYDQNLKASGPSRGWVPNAWTELKYP